MALLLLVLGLLVLVGVASYVGAFRATRSVRDPLEDMAAHLTALRAERSIYDVTAQTVEKMLDAARDADRRRS